MPELKDFFVDLQDELYERQVFVVDKGQEPMRIDKWLHIRLYNITRNKIQKGIEAGFVTVNGKEIKNNYRIKPGDEVTILVEQSPENGEIIPEPIPLNIVYEDESVMVINKPANIVVHPGVGNYAGTLLNGIAYHLLEQDSSLTEDELPRYGLVHRIDKNTTGLLVVAKTDVAASHLARQFYLHTTSRKYIALVWGDVKEDEGTIDAHIARHLRYRKIFDAYPEGDHGKHAVTHYRVLERFHYVTLVECILETGRTHQIRVHMKYIGHTLFNDWEYGGDKILKGTVFNKYKQFVDNCFEVCPRIALHAQTLGFDHPKTGKRMNFFAPLPSDMSNVIEKWRDYVKPHQL